MSVIIIFNPEFSRAWVFRGDHERSKGGFVNSLSSLITVKKIIVLIIVVTLFFIVGRMYPASDQEDKIVLTPREKPLPMFPCSGCHDGEDVNYKHRIMVDEHTDKTLHHAEKDRWCLDCHDPIKRDYLRLANGQLIPFNNSQKLCGQCHGTQYRDWKKGLHGKRVGFWNGEKQYRICISCHNPHSPAFAPLKPKPRPLRPEEIKYNSDKKAENEHK